MAYYRKLQGLTQEKLANKLGVATSYVGQIEAAGMYKPISLTTLLRIAEALDTPAYKFLEFWGMAKRLTSCFWDGEGKKSVADHITKKKWEQAETGGEPW